MVHQVSLIIEKLSVGQMATNCYLLVDRASRSAIIIDPGDDPEFILEHLTRLKAEPQKILATHGHFDHLLAARAIQLAYNLPFLIHKADLFLIEQYERSAKYYLGLGQVDPAPEITETLTDKQSVSFGASTLRVLATPGHTPGSVCFYTEREQALFVGDTLFADGGVGRTDFSYSRPKELHQSIEKILGEPRETVLYPGHGRATSIGSERTFHSV